MTASRNSMSKEQADLIALSPSVAPPALRSLTARPLCNRAVSERRAPKAKAEQLDAFIPPEWFELADKHQLFPTNPWQVRAMLEMLGPALFPHWPIIPSSVVVYENCAGLGHMVAVLRKVFRDVRASDIHDWGKGFAIADALTFRADVAADNALLITNPPFDGEDGNMAEKIVRQALKSCRHVIVHQRLGFICGQGRHSLHFANPEGNLRTFLPCTERTPMRLGFYDPDCDKPGEHAWFHYEQGYRGFPAVVPIPPGMKAKHLSPEDVKI